MFKRFYKNRYGYSRWDGTQNIEGLDADDILNALADDYMEDGNLQQSLKQLMQEGIRGEDGRRTMGLRELMERMRNMRNEQLNRYNMASGVMDDLREKLEEIKRLEREGIQRRRPPFSARDRPLLDPPLCPDGRPERTGRLAGTHVFALGRNRGGSRHRERQRRARCALGEPRAGGKRGPGLRYSPGSRDGASESAGCQRREAGRLDRARAGRRAVHAGDGRGAYRLKLPCTSRSECLGIGPVGRPNRAPTKSHIDLPC